MAYQKVDDYIQRQEAVNANWVADYLRGLAPDEIIAFDSQVSAEKKGILKKAFAALGASNSHDNFTVKEIT